MDDEVFGGRGSLGSGRLPQVSMTFLEACRNDCGKEYFWGGQGPPGFPWMPWAFFRNLKKTLWMMKFFGGCAP